MMCDLDNPHKLAVFEGQVSRSLWRNPGLVRHLVSNVKMADVWSPNGLWLGQRPTLPLDGKRIDRSLVKIVKGLYYLIREAPLPPDSYIELIGSLMPKNWPLIQAIERQLSPAFNYGDTVFEWSFAQRRDGVTMWKLAFYQSVAFYALVLDHQAQHAIGMEGGEHAPVLTT
jgi:beta-galactosidase GanA